MPVTPLTSRKTTSDAQTRDGLRWLCQNDLFALARMILYKDAKTPMSEEFHRPVVRFRQSSPFERNLYLLSRDHLKTSLLTCAGNVQRILRNPQIRILLAGNKAESAQTQLSEIKGHLVNPLLVWLFPEILYDDPQKQAETWATEKIVVKRKFRSKEATIETIGAEGAITGRHFEHGHYDDLVDEHNSATRDQIYKIIRWYQTTQSLFEPHATQEIVGTPWEFGDLYDWLVEMKMKREFSLGVYRQPCWKTTHPGELRVGERGGIAEDDFILDAAGRKIPAYGEKFTYDAIRSKEVALGARIFAAQWMLRPVDDSSALFPRGKAVIRSRKEIPPLSQLWTVACVDPASSTKEWADHTAIVVMGWDAQGQAYLLEVRQGQWPESEVIDNVYSVNATYQPRTIGFEAVGFQKLYMPLFAAEGERRGFLPIVKLERDTTVGKTTRIRSLEPLWSNSGLVIAADCTNLEDFLDQAARFRAWKKDQPDDMLDAAADCLQMRVRPEVEDPLADLPEEERERRNFEQANQHLDRASLKQAYHLWRMDKDAEARRDEQALGGGPLSEFYAGG